MVKGLVGKKVEMTQVYDKHGRVVPITKLKVEPNFVVQIKAMEKDGYKAAQLGSGSAKKPGKTAVGHAKKATLESVPRILTEFVYDGELKAGQEITLDQVFRKGSVVDIRGVSKGKGFAGVVKRWGFAGGPRTHGQSDRERAPGSIGAGTTPGRVFKGLKMAGHMGAENVTVKGLEIIELLAEENELWVKGSVPGSRGTDLLIIKSEKRKKSYHELEIPETPLGAKAEQSAQDDTDGEPEKEETVGQTQSQSEEKEI